MNDVPGAAVRVTVTALVSSIAVGSFQVKGTLVTPTGRFKMMSLGQSLITGAVLSPADWAKT